MLIISRILIMVMAYEYVDTEASKCYGLDIKGWQVSMC